jgi:hypothetical protein
METSLKEKLKEKITFLSYDEYKKFVSAISGDFQDIDLDAALYEALINNDCTPKEAKSFLVDDLTYDNVSEIRLYRDRMVFEITNVEFIEAEYDENNIVSFTIAFYFRERQWHWIEMF